MYKNDGWIVKDLQEHHGQTHIDEGTGVNCPRTRSLTTLLCPLPAYRCLSLLSPPDLDSCSPLSNIKET